MTDQMHESFPEPSAMQDHSDHREHTDARSMLEDRNRSTYYEGEATDGSGIIGWKGKK